VGAGEVNRIVVPSGAARHRLGSYHAVCAAAVFDDHRLARGGSHPGRHEAREDVGAVAGLERNYDLERPGLSLRKRACREKQESVREPTHR